MTDSLRSLAPMNEADLARLAAIAAEVEADLFERHPEASGRYAGRLICRALCQGAALHYLDDRNGVKDLDVWSFYAELPDLPFPARWSGKADYGPSKFGRFSGDPAKYTGRRVDLMGRSLAVPAGADPEATLRDWLAGGRTGSARALASKAAILIAPEPLLGTLVWPA